MYVDGQVARPSVCSLKVQQYQEHKYYLFVARILQA